MTQPGAQDQPERSEASKDKLIAKNSPHSAVAGRQLKHIKNVGPSVARNSRERDKEQTFILLARFAPWPPGLQTSYLYNDRGTAS